MSETLQLGLITDQGLAAATAEPRDPRALTFVVHGQAQPAGSKRSVPMGGRYGVVDANPKAHSWKRHVAQHVGEAHDGTLLEGPLYLQLVFYQPRPKGHYGRHGLLPRAPAHPAKRPDLTKLIRGVEDALTGVLWGDDAQIVVQVCAKRFGPARVEITVAPYPSEAA